jgi:hypothetical protein
MKKSVQLAIRLPEELVKEVDGTARYLERIQKSGVSVTRSDAVRYLIRGGIIHMKDLELIRQIAKTEPCFTSHAAHEARAYKLFQQGYLNREQALFAQRGSRKEYRWRYSLTERARRYS